MEEEGRPLLVHGTDRRRCRWKLVVGIVASTLVLCAAILVGILFPRVPNVAVASAGLPAGFQPPTIVVTPPTMFIPIVLSLRIENANFYTVRSLNSSWVAGFYSSSIVDPHQVMLGRALQAAGEVDARSTTVLNLGVDLSYNFFASPVVLSEIAADCAVRGAVNVTLRLGLHLSALFLRNLTLEMTLEVRLPCD